MTPDLGRIGARLRGAGLTESALLAWSGTHRIPMVSRRISGLAARPPTPAAAALSLFVAGATLTAEQLRLVPVEELVALALIEAVGDGFRALVSIIPLEAQLLVCDRDDAADVEELLLWPDDSSYHLASAIAPGRRERWLDLACGSAFAPLARPQLAAQITGVDLNPRAVELARLGAALSGCGHLSVEQADIGAAHPPAALVTCNAPIPDDRDIAIWRRTDRAFFDRMWPSARGCTAPGGQVVAHTTLDAIPDELSGEVVTVVYTPPGEHGYAVTWWTPDAPSRRVIARRMLTPIRPHLEPADREDALAGTLDAVTC